MYIERVSQREEGLNKALVEKQEITDKME